MEEVSLRLIEKGDIPYVQQYASKKEVSATTNIPYPYPEDGAKLWFEFINKGREEDSLYAFAILFNGEFAGSISVRRIDKEKDIGAIDYWIAPPFWNKGIGTKAAKKAIEYGFKVLGIRNMESFCLVENIGSGKVLEKNGFNFVKDFEIGEGKHKGKKAKLYRLEEYYNI